MIKSQSGVTLISLLIGLLISMLCMIGLLSTYRTVAKTGAESRIDATHDTQLQNGLTASQMMIQNAGFGLDGGMNLEVATISIGTATNVSALLWRYKEGSTVSCQGLADIPDASKRKLVTLTVGTGCNDTAALDTLTWTTENALAHLTDYSSGGTNPQQITFAKTLSNCTPFGSAISENVVSHPLVTITAKTSTQNIAGLDAIEVPVCILNITT